LPLWITEAGYFSVPGVIDPNAANCPAGGDTGIGGFSAYEVSETDEANFVVQAYQLAYSDWPWLGMFILMNLDISMDSVSSRAQCDPARFWAVLLSNGQPTTAYSKLQTMIKDAAQLVFTSGSNTESSGTMTMSGSLIDPSAT